MEQSSDTPQWFVYRKTITGRIQIRDAVMFAQQGGFDREWGRQWTPIKSTDPRQARQQSYAQEEGFTWKPEAREKLWEEVKALIQPIAVNARKMEQSASVPNLEFEIDFTLPAHFKGGKFKAVHWNDINRAGAPIIGWGISFMPPDTHVYRPIGCFGELHPFSTKAVAARFCQLLNKKASAP